jgi:DNA modification methylase
MLLGHFQDNRKFGKPQPLNKYHKPLLVFMRHLLCWTKMGDRVIDITSGAGTTVVRLPLSLAEKILT